MYADVCMYAKGEAKINQDLLFFWGGGAGRSKVQYGTKIKAKQKKKHTAG